jgi:PAS domain S-box-containing protein
LNPAGTWREAVPRTALRAATAIPLVLVAVALRLWLVRGPGRDTPFLTFFPMVVVAVLLGGWAAALGTSLLSVLVVYFWIQQRRVSFMEAMATVAFGVLSLLICHLFESRRLARVASRDAGAALAESEHHFQQLFHSIQEGFSLRQILTDESGRAIDFRFLAVNPAFAELAGVRPDQVVGRTIKELRPGVEPEWLEAFGRVALMGESLRVEHFSPYLQRWFQMHAFSPEPGQFAVLSLDITDRKRMAEEDRQARETAARKALKQERSLRRTQLEALNLSLEAKVREAVAELRQKDKMLITQNRQAAMGEMIGHIAHQWRQPLNAISMLLVNLGDAYRLGDLTPDKLERTLAKGDLLLQKMSSTINDFRDFIKPDKTLTPFSALRQVQDAVALVEAGFEAGNIQIRIEADSDVTLFGFPNEYSQVLLNLLGNAKLAIAHAGANPGLVRIVLTRADGFGCLTVTDNGGGIPEPLLDRIFEPYFSTRESGTGLGLYMSRQIIEQSMNGQIKASNAEAGAEFSIQVPVAAEAL